MGGGVRGGTLDLERKKCLAEAESEARESYTPITIACGPPTGTGNTIGAHNPLRRHHPIPCPPALGFSPHASLWPLPPTHCNVRVPIITTPFSTQEPPQRHPHTACNPCHYDANNDSNLVNDDRDAEGDGSSDGGGDTEGDGGSDAEGDGDSDAEGNDGCDAVAGMTWRWE
ncbi:hypothetical protein EDB83DRAFT_2323522 [Lactarius deliciosus]|nr:hypothetical protein EDB83DRAFT_2323522 [Lactarius deliciosus]